MYSRNTAKRSVFTFSFGVVGLATGLMFLPPPLHADTKSKAAGPIAARQSMMDTAKFAAGTAGAMVEGKAPYDARTAELAMRTLNAVALGFGHKFPDDSKTGGDTEAKAEIWSEMDNFQHLVHEMEEHSEKAAKVAANGLEAFKVEFAATMKYCKECHKKYRDIKKK